MDLVHSAFTFCPRLHLLSPPAPSVPACTFCPHLFPFPNPENLHTHHEAMNIAKQSHSLLSYDPNLHLPLWPSPESTCDSIMSIWNEADIVKLSDEEVKFLTNGKDEQLDATLMELWHPNMKLLLVTDGPNGCRYYTPSFCGRVESFQVCRSAARV